MRWRRFFQRRQSDAVNYFDVEEVPMRLVKTSDDDGSLRDQIKDVCQQLLSDN
jgi:hypothetical protein